MSADGNALCFTRPRTASSLSADPHTAVAVHVANELLLRDATTPVLISSTAHYAKFPNAMCRAFDQKVPQAEAEDLAKMLAYLRKQDPAVYDATMHTQLAKLPNMPVLHAEHCKADVPSVVERIKVFLREFAAKQA
jgi:threonine synthase